VRISAFVTKLLLSLVAGWGLAPGAAAQAARSFSGEWNEHKATEIALRIAGSWQTSTQHSGVTSEKSPRNEVYAFLPFDKDGVTRWLALVSQSPSDNNCHACSPTTGAVIFTRNGNVFEADYDQAEIASIGGGWGKPPQARFQTLGPSKPAVVFQIDGMGQGYAGRTLTFVAEVDGRLRRVFSLQVAGSNEAAGLPEDQTFQWDSLLEFTPRPNGGYSDIRVKSTGTKEVEVAGTQQVRPYSSDVVYRFEDGVYKPLK
jgi:hypothetical protein